jgi:hypothetical protein
MSASQIQINVYNGVHVWKMAYNGERPVEKDLMASIDP